MLENSLNAADNKCYGFTDQSNIHDPAADTIQHNERTKIENRFKYIGLRKIRKESSANSHNSLNEQLRAASLLSMEPK